MRQAKRILPKLLLILLAAFPAAYTQAEPYSTILRGATLIDGNGGPPTLDSVVVIQDQRIVEVATIDSIGPEFEGNVIDLRGKFLLPGFIDVHAHVTLDGVSMKIVEGAPQLKIAYVPDTTRGLLSNLLADGVTGIRNPGGVASIAVDIREQIRSGALLGPDIRTAGDVLSTVPFEGLTAVIGSREDITAEISRQAAVGVDAIKIYFDLPVDQFEFAIEAAHKLGLPAISHTGVVNWTEAARMGIDSLLHIVPTSVALLPEAKRQQYLDTRRPGSLEYFEWYELVEFDAPEIIEMITILAQKQVFVDPDLVMFEAVFLGGDDAITANPELNRLPPHLLNNWRTFFNMNVGWTADDFRRARAAWPKALMLTRALFDAGVPLALGTDLGNPWIVPGQSLHREMALMAQAGIPPMDILIMATHNGARLMGTASETGTVEVGKLANLVVLDADPLQDIANSRSISRVILRGRMLDPEDLRVNY